MAPRPRGKLTPETLHDVRKAKLRLRQAEIEYRGCVLDALAEGSFREVSEATGLSLDTLQRWKREAGQ